MPQATATDPLPDDTAALQALVAGLRAQIAELQQQLAWFTEQYRLAQHRRFAASSERCAQQLALFAAVLDDAQQAAAGAGTSALNDPSRRTEGNDNNPTPHPQRRRTGRPALPPQLPREQITHDLPEEQKVCRCCGKRLHLIGDTRSEQLDIEPPKLKVIEHIQLKYACAGCAQGGVDTAPKPPQPIPKSNAAPGLLAYLAIAKVADGLPLYRQERMFERLGFSLPRSTQAAWLSKAGQLIQPLINLLYDELVARDIILADEITFQVLKEPGRAAQTQS